MNTNNNTLMMKDLHGQMYFSNGNQDPRPWYGLVIIVFIIIVFVLRYLTNN